MKRSFFRPLNAFVLIVLAGAPFIGLVENRAVSGGYVLLHCIACFLLCGRVLFVPRFHDAGARCLASALGLWGLGDLFWVWNYYLNAHSSRSLFAILTTESFYPLCFGLMMVGLVRRLLPSVSTSVWKLVGGLTLLLVPFVAKLLVIPLVQSVAAGNANIPFVVFEAVAISLSFVALLCSCVTVVVTTDQKWAVVSSGGITLILADWGIRSAKILGVVPVFTYSTFLILLGCYVIGIALASPRENPAETRDLSLRSLTSWMKAASVCLLFFPLAFLGLVDGVTAETLAKATFCAAAGAVLVVVLVHYAVESWQRKMFIAFPSTVRSPAMLAGHELEGVPQEFASVLAGLLVSGAKNARDWKQLAHDLRSPLSALSVASDMFRERPEAAASLAKRAVERIGEMASDLERSDERSQPSEARPFCAVSLVREVVDEHRVRLGEQSGMVQLESPQGAWLCTGSAIEFRRAVSNLVDNAIRAARERSGTVHVEVVPAGRRCEIRIQDTGVGMSDETLQQIRRYGRPLTYKGTGLGLLHAHRVVASLEGELSFESSGVNQGTLVRIKLRVGSAIA